MKLNLLHESISREEIHLAFALEHLLDNVEHDIIAQVVANNSGNSNLRSIKDVMDRCEELNISYFGEVGESVTFDPLKHELDGSSLPGDIIKIAKPGVWQAHKTNCASCKGSGEAQRPDGVWDDCPACDGYGEVDARPKILVRAKAVD